MRASSLIIIPAYNEGESLLLLLKAIRSVTSCPALLVDDGSSDGSAGEARRIFPSLMVLRHETRLGYGHALIDGLKVAMEEEIRYCLTIDADGQHLPALIPRFLQEVRKVHVVSGSRYMTDLPENHPPPISRYLINRLMTFLLNDLTGYSLTDAFCGFKAYQVAALKSLSLTEPGYAFPIQFWIQAAFNHLKVKEIPVPRLYPSPGRSFGGALDSPLARLGHYLQVMRDEVERVAAARACGMVRDQACCAGLLPAGTLLEADPVNARR